MDEKKIDKIISSMTLEEKAGICSGKDNWYLKNVDRLGVPSVMVSDGPHGLRTQRGQTDHLGLNESIEAVCFPAACATAASFDRELLRETGEILGQECQAENVSVLLGPAMNIKRSPLCGRNFEYFSEDPYLTGELASSYVDGVQSKGIGVSLKHFAANNQETRRVTVSSNVSERAFREIYLSAFENVVKKSKPKTIMCSYNRINGVHASENKRLLTDILRNEWGFDGYVMSDWGAVVDRVKGLNAGLDLEMPYSGVENDAKIVAAVKSGELKEEVLDRAVKRILTVSFDYIENKRDAKIDLDADHIKAVEAAKKCIVLLKNDDKILPLKNEKTAFIGEFAFKPRYQGGGSSHINSFKTTSAIEAAKNNKSIVSCCGYCVADESKNDELLVEAVNLAKNVDKAVLFIGLPDSFESEGYDRLHMDLPEAHNRLVEEVAKVQPNTVVVLHNGSPVGMPWVDKVKGIIEVYLGGQGVGEATYSVLTGECNPSARLPETFPVKLSDNPSHLNFPGDGDNCNYAEGIYVGYRYYDKKDMEVLYPFGFGLSYTDFEYSNLSIDKVNAKSTDIITVSVDVKNIGKCCGEEVIQLYISDKTGEVSRPVKELKGFTKLSLAPNESKTAKIQLDSRSFAYYDEDTADWIVPSGKYEIIIAKNAKATILTKTLTMTAPAKKFTVTRETTMGDLMRHEATKPFVIERMQKAAEKFGGGKKDASLMGINLTENFILRLVEQMPLRSIKSFMNLTEPELDVMVEKFNSMINE